MLGISLKTLYNRLAAYKANEPAAEDDEAPPASYLMSPLVGGVRPAKMRTILGHQRIMRSIYFGALILAGYFTFMPGRIMHRTVFGGLESPHVPVAAGSIAALAVLYFCRRLSVLN
jgi:hypothetical protein